MSYEYCIFITYIWLDAQKSTNLFMTPKNEFSNSPIYEFEVLQNVFKNSSQG